MYFSSSLFFASKQIAFVETSQMLASLIGKLEVWGAFNVPESIFGQKLALKRFKPRIVLPKLK